MKTPKNEITKDEWLRELEALSKRSDDGLSSRELAEKMCCNVKLARERIAKLNRLGRIAVGCRMEPAIDGKLARVPVYRII